MSISWFFFNRRKTFPSLTSEYGKTDFWQYIYRFFLRLNIEIDGQKAVFSNLCTCSRFLPNRWRGESRCRFFPAPYTKTLLAVFALCSKRTRRCRAKNQKHFEGGGAASQHSRPSHRCTIPAQRSPVPSKGAAAPFPRQWIERRKKRRPSPPGPRQPSAHQPPAWTHLTTSWRTASVMRMPARLASINRTMPSSGDTWTAGRAAL